MNDTPDDRDVVACVYPGAELQNDTLLRDVDDVPDSGRTSLFDLKRSSVIDVASKLHIIQEVSLFVQVESAIF
jgi:hypothetical protein